VDTQQTDAKKRSEIIYLNTVKRGKRASGR